MREMFRQISFLFADCNDWPDPASAEALKSYRLASSRRRRFFWIFACNVLASLLEGVSFIWILVAFSVLGHGIELESAMYAIPGMRYVTPGWNIASWDTGLVFIFGIILAVTTQVFRACVAFIGQMASVSLTNRLQVFFQDRIYQHIMSFSFAYASHYKVGDLVEYSVGPSQCIPGVMDHLNKSVVAFFTVLVLLITMCLLSPFLTLLALTIFGLLGGMQQWVVRKVMAHSERLADHLSDFSKDTVQSLQGLRAIFLFDRQQEMLQKISHLLRRMAGTRKQMSLWMQLIPFISEISGVCLVGLFLSIGEWTGGSRESLPMLLTFVTIVYRLNGKTQAFLASLGEIATFGGQMTRMAEILGKKGKEFAPQKGKLIHRLEREIQLREVTLRYPGRTVPSIKGLSCTIPKGKMTALVGLSGAGKSSLLDLLLRLYLPTTGHIEVDGVSLHEYQLGSWRRLFGVVSQDIFVFNETIEENIRFGDPQIDLRKIHEAAEIAGAHGFISQLPQGYQTLVGERGYRLSGGERQRLALARALVKDPDIVVLDEATSNLDSQSELQIRESLQRLQHEKTLIVVAHRLSTIIHADQILVMDQGSICQQGTHDELMAQEGIYQKLWLMQALCAKAGDGCEELGQTK